jgi:hypothetical protein
MNEFLTREEERKQEAKAARAGETNERKRLAAEAAALRDELRGYLHFTNRPELEVDVEGEVVMIARGKMAMQVMVRPDDRYSLEHPRECSGEPHQGSVGSQGNDRCGLNWLATATGYSPHARMAYRVSGFRTYETAGAAGEILDRGHAVEGAVVGGGWDQRLELVEAMSMARYKDADFPKR